MMKIAYHYMYSIYISLIISTTMSGKFNKSNNLIKQLKELIDSNTLNWEEWFEKKLSKILLKYNKFISKSKSKPEAEPIPNEPTPKKERVLFISLLFKLAVLNKLGDLLKNSVPRIKESNKINNFPLFDGKPNDVLEGLSQTISAFKIPIFIDVYGKEFAALSDLLREYSRHYFEGTLTGSDRRQIYEDLNNIFIQNGPADGCDYIKAASYLSNKDKLNSFRANIPVTQEISWIKKSMLTTIRNYTEENDSTQNFTTTTYKDGIEIYKGRSIEKLYSCCIDSCDPDRMIVAIGSRGIREISIKNSLSQRPRSDNGLKLMDDEGHSFVECLKRYSASSVNKNASFISIQASIEYLFPAPSKVIL